jgi:hypothetical protein
MKPNEGKEGGDVETQNREKRTKNDVANPLISFIRKQCSFFLLYLDGRVREERHANREGLPTQVPSCLYTLQLGSRVAVKQMESKTTTSGAGLRGST